MPLTKKEIITQLRADQVVFARLTDAYATHNALPTAQAEHLIHAIAAQLAEDTRLATDLRFAGDFERLSNRCERIVLRVGQLLLLQQRKPSVVAQVEIAVRVRLERQSIETQTRMLTLFMLHHREDPKADQKIVSLRQCGLIELYALAGYYIRPMTDSWGMPRLALLCDYARACDAGMQRLEALFEK